MKGFNKDIAPVTIISWIKPIQFYPFTLLHQVKAHDVQAFAASTVFQS